MNIIVLGAGAIGTYIGALLSKKYRVKLVCKGKNLKKVEKKRVELRGYHKGIFYLSLYNHFPEIKENTLILVTVKAYDLVDALLRVKNKVKKDTIFLLIQNGLDIKERVLSFMHNKVVRAITGIGAEILEQGIINTSWGKIVIELSEVSKEIVNIFENCGFNARLSDDIKKDEWFKVCINAFVNPITALLKIKNSKLLNSHLKEIIQKIIDEVIHVAEMEGIDIDRERIERTIERLKNYNNFSSMYYDVVKGEKTEIDYINGEIVKRGVEYGIDVSANKLLYSFIKFLET